MTEISSVFIGCVLLDVVLAIILLRFKVKKNSYSLVATVIVFQITFFCITPLIMMLKKVSYWGFYINYDAFIYAKLLTTIGFFCLTITYLNFIINSRSESKDLNPSPLKIKKSYILTISIALIIFQLYIEDFNYLNLIIRDYGPGRPIPTIFWLINLTFIKTIPFAIFLTIKLKKNCRIDWVTEVILILTILILTFPAGIPRFMAGIIYFPIFYIYTLKKINIGYISVLTGSLLFIFPMLEIARSAIAGGNSDINIVDYLIGNFTDGHLDAFQGILMTLKEKSDYGFQIIGAVLFFIPRIFWPTKPIGLGQFLAEKNDLVFTNISMPLIGEFYYAFDVYGVVIGYLFIGVLFSLLDQANNKNPSPIYLALVPMMMILLRGDLFTGISFFTGMLLSIKIWGHITKKYLMIKYEKFEK